MKHAQLALVLMLITASSLFSTTLTVALDGSQDYTTVQAAVNAATHGDIILVYPGIYFENIVIIDKFITLASLNYTTGDEQYIHSTILDGNHNGSVIRLALDTLPQPADVVIQGFTIIHGSGYCNNPYWAEYGGGGLFIMGANSTDNYLNVQLTNCQIKYNDAQFGAGINVAYRVNMHMRNVSVHHNVSTSSTGGVNVVRSNLIHYQASPCNYYMNQGTQGHDLFIIEPEQSIVIHADTVSVPDPDENSFIEFHLDDEDDPYELTLTYQHHVFELIDHDLYVSPDGNDDNSGLSPAEPLGTIRRAAMLIKSNPENPRTIHLAPGLYTDILDEQKFGIGLKDYISIRGSGPDETVIDCYAKHFITMSYTEHHGISDLSMKSSFLDNISGSWSPNLILCAYVDDLRIENVRAYDSIVGQLPAIQVWHTHRCSLNNAIIEGITAYGEASLSLIGYDLSIDQCVIRNNQSVSSDNMTSGRTAFVIWAKGNSSINALQVANNVNLATAENRCTGYLTNGIGTPESQLRVTNSLFCDNISGVDYSFLVKPYSGQIEFTNCTFANNSSSEYMIKYRRTSDQYDVEPIIFTNCVLWDSTAYEMVNASGQRCAIEVQHSLVRNGEGGIYSPYDEVIWGEGNLDLDPLLLGVEDYCYPMEGSPLINAGTPDTTGLCLPSHDLMHRARVWDGCIDIGCHEYGSVSVTPDPEPEEVPATPLALANYPNPFNPWTRITYSLPEAAHVKLSVYNIRGQRLTTLVDEHLAAGEHSAVWDGRDERMNIVAGGVYLLRLQAGERTEVRKVLMVK